MSYFIDNQGAFWRNDLDQPEPQRVPDDGYGPLQMVKSHQYGAYLLSQDGNLYYYNPVEHPATPISSKLVATQLQTITDFIVVSSGPALVLLDNNQQLTLLDLDTRETTYFDVIGNSPVIAINEYYDDDDDIKFIVITTELVATVKIEIFNNRLDIEVREICGSQGIVKAYCTKLTGHYIGAAGGPTDVMYFLGSENRLMFGLYSDYIDPTEAITYFSRQAIVVDDVKDFTVVNYGNVNYLCILDTEGSVYLSANLYRILLQDDQYREDVRFPTSVSWIPLKLPMIDKLPPPDSSPKYAPMNFLDRNRNLWSFRNNQMKPQVTENVVTLANSIEVVSNRFLTTKPAL